jgi:3-oxoacyl-[acyl-carrier-protein] synthase-3
MSQLRTANARVAGLAATLPKQFVSTDQAAVVAGVADVRKVVSMTGITGRNVATSSVCTSDLCFDAARRLLGDLGWKSDSVDALVFVTQTPDYRLPATACVLQDRLGLSSRCAAFDVNIGCAGFVYGLSVCASLVDAGMERVLLLTGDTLSKFVNPADKSCIFLFGDAGTATAIERGSNQLSFVLGSDGEGAQHLMIPAGMCREPGEAGSHSAVECEGGNIRSRHQLYMNGAEVMNFTLRALPRLWDELALIDPTPGMPFDAVVMHQANQFILNALAKRLNISPDKVPSTLSRFGNTSSASIPITIADQLADKFSQSAGKMVLMGFGVGWSWAGCIGSFGPMRISEAAYI